MDWFLAEIPEPDQQFYQKAKNRQSQLTKPPGSMGELERIAERLAALQCSETPSVDRVWVSVFAADHGVAEESVSAFPQAVSVEMVKNFSVGGAAINVLSRYLQADFEVIDVGLIKPVVCRGVISDRAGEGTANFCKQAAMTELQLGKAMLAGKSAVIRAVQSGAELFIGGDMGIANTASAAALASALLNKKAAELTGAGTGLSAQQVEYKTRVIQSALDKHHSALESPLKILQYLGGFEIVALTGAFIHAAQRRLPVLVDGFIATAAALCAVKMNIAVKEWLFFAHCSHEKGHRLLLRELAVRPILDLDMRLGEGSGAAAAVPLMQIACRLHNEMATFEQAHITTE